MRKFGFYERLDDIMWRLSLIKWYTIKVNGQPFIFFESSRGLNWRDPMSPIFYIIVYEVLSWGLNWLHQDFGFKIFGLLKLRKDMNHLSYVDDTIIFCSGHSGPVKTW